MHWDLGEAWQPVNPPVLVIRGSADDIMNRADSLAIAGIVNLVHLGHARYLEIEGMESRFRLRNKFYGTLVPTVLEWMKQQLN
jgi:hypothetical protein